METNTVFEEVFDKMNRTIFLHKEQHSMRECYRTFIADVFSGVPQGFLPLCSTLRFINDIQPAIYK